MIGHGQLIADTYNTLHHLHALSVSFKLLPHPPLFLKPSPSSPKKRRSTPPDTATLELISEIVRRETQSPPPALDVDSNMHGTLKMVNQSLDSSNSNSNSNSSITKDNMQEQEQEQEQEQAPSAAKKEKTTKATACRNEKEIIATKTTNSPDAADSTIWIFGYGSLLWKCDYPIVRFLWGWVKGYKRRLWQGSPDHRGTTQKPGRVFTMLPAAMVEKLEHQHNNDDDHNDVVWGRCFELERSVAVKVMKEIDIREIAGFSKELLVVHGVDGSTIHNAVVYSALPTNAHFLGPASLKDIAAHCYHSVGPSGRNDDYVTNTLRALSNAGASKALLDSHLQGVCTHLAELRSLRSLMTTVTAKSYFERRPDGTAARLLCRGRLVDIVSPNRSPTSSVTLDWPIVYYRFVESDDDSNTLCNDKKSAPAAEALVVYHCNIHDDHELLPFVQINKKV